jgi:hypothetical protein
MAFEFRRLQNTRETRWAHVQGNSRPEPKGIRIPHLQGRRYPPSCYWPFSALAFVA